MHFKVYNPHRYRIERPEAVQAMHVDFEKAADLWEEAQSFLRTEFARPL